MSRILFIDIKDSIIDYKFNDQIFFAPLVITTLFELQSIFTSIILFYSTKKKHNNIELIVKNLVKQGISIDNTIKVNNIIDIKKYITENNLDNSKIIIVSPLEQENHNSFDNLEKYFIYNEDDYNWQIIKEKLIYLKNNDNDTSIRHALVHRKTKETDISVEIWLDKTGDNAIDTGIGFFDHMLDQIATHAGFKMKVLAKGDLHIDDHHTIEDTAIVLGTALKKALADKRGIRRFGFVVVMDETHAKCMLDLSGRPYIKFKAKFSREKVGDFSCEMTPHFFRSLAFALECSLHIECKGENTHHQIESLFKVFGRTIRQAITIQGNELPSSKGIL